MTEAPRVVRRRLPYSSPFDWAAMLAFLAARATPGVEAVGVLGYRRTIAVGEAVGSIGVRHSEGCAAIDLEIRFPTTHARRLIADRVTRMFDLHADAPDLARTLRRDSLLRAPLSRHPGIRVPRAWDGFELAVRAILGQQVSVRGATTLAGRLADGFGAPVRGLEGAGLSRVFPTPAQLVDAPVEAVGLIRSRAGAIRALARAVLDGDVILSPGGDASAQRAALTRISGIGDWTAQYIAMRALGDRDAMPAGDLILRRTAGVATARELERRSEAWRPWRAYAVMLLWQDATDRAAARPQHRRSR